MKVRNCKNVIFNATFVINNLDKMRSTYKFSSGALKLIALAERDGLKCDCCNAGNITYKYDPELGMMMYAGKHRMTMDHDLLNSLDGSNDVGNQHLLCYRCNQLRGNLFAEYKEFKDWYNHVVEQGKKPQNQINSVKRNFSYLALEKNGYTRNQTITLHKCNEMSDMMKHTLFTHYKKHGAFRNCDGFYGLHTLITHSEEAWDDALNEMMVKVVKWRLGLDIELPTSKYTVFSTKKSTKTTESFLANLNLKFNQEYARQKQKAKQAVSAAKAPEYRAKAKAKEQQMTVVPVKMTMWQKLTGFISNLVA